MKTRSHAGFTLVELMVTMAIVAVLSGISILLYNQYVTRARATDILSKYDAARSTVGATLAGQSDDPQCATVAEGFGAPIIADDYARISYRFEAVRNGNETGYRPVLTVCARAADQGAPAVKVARAAHDELAKNTAIENGAVLTDSVVSFALPLTDRNRLVCRVPAPSPTNACGDPQIACPAGRESVTLPSGTTICILACPAGQAHGIDANPLKCVPVK